MAENKIVLYMHAGSGNHGCEAIVNSLCHMLSSQPLVLTNSVEEDLRYSLASDRKADGRENDGRDKLCELAQEKHFSEHRIAHVLYYIWRKLTKDGESFIRYRYSPVFDNPLSAKGKDGKGTCGNKGKVRYPLAISIGGDNYCYDVMIKDLILANRAFHKRGSKTILLGCSIEPELLGQEHIVEDMRLYNLIIARESLTFEALAKIVSKEKLRLIPDPAFTLGTKKLPLPQGFAEGNTIGINVSPMIQDSEAKAGITMDNYKALLEYIISATDMQIALIPHVVWERNDDRKPIRELYETFRETGRVILIEDASCEEIKGYIARCRMFIGARTHATIAAYSSLVPTLVVGYSVKAKGIAKDLFGTYENYVLPVQQLQNREELIHAFEWLKANEEKMRATLAQVMPEYKERAAQAGKEVEKVWEEFNMQQKI